MFSPSGTYSAVGVFSTTHIISIFVCFGFIALAVFLSREMTKDEYFKLLKVFSIIVSCLELIKIIWSWSMGYFDLTSWVPLWLCSLFIYSLWFTWFKSKFIRELGLSYIAIACIVGGVAFIISPSTSFVLFPIFHYQCIHSMIFHSIMIYCGIMMFVTRSFSLNWKVVRNYSEFCIIFIVFALILDLTRDSNLMFLMNPNGIPVSFLKDIHSFSKAVYTSLVIVFYLVIGPIVLGIDRLCLRLNKFKKKENMEQTFSVFKTESLFQDGEDIIVTNPLIDVNDESYEE